MKRAVYKIFAAGAVCWAAVVFPASSSDASNAFISQVPARGASASYVRQLPRSARVRAPKVVRRTRRRTVRRAAPRRVVQAQRTNASTVQAVVTTSANITDFGAPDARRSLVLPNVRDGVSVRIVRRNRVTQP